MTDDFNIKQRNCEDCMQINQLFLDFYSKLHSENEKYTSLVLSIGYASFCSILFTTNQPLIKESSCTFFISIIALIFSILLFVTYEVIKIKNGHDYETEILKNISKVMDENVKFNYKEFKLLISKIQTEKFSHLFKYTPAYFKACIILSIVALFFYLLSILIYFI
ncbi:MAG: hypothetical protein PHX18_05250 [Candidatus Gastranaerophilales bacterium]|nr:hypothetical protein [Candidatus Gastranaerophilales bacterium]